MCYNEFANIEGGSVMSTVGDRIRKKRKEIGISQTDLAQKVNISKQTLYKYEKNIVANIPFDKIEEISKVLCVPASFLMGWGDNLTNDNADLLTDILCNEDLVEHIKKLMVISKKHQQTIFDNIDYWFEKEGH